MKFEYPKGATPIDADEAADLIPNLTTQKELNEWEQTNISEAVIKHHNKKYSTDEILDVNFLLGIHKDMFGKTWKWAGQIRKSEKNIGSAPERIREHLKILIDDVKFWLINTTYSKDETCVRFHRRIVGIHLFPNGNGRHARFVTDLLAESLGIQPFTWGSKDLYINALKEADKNNYEPLLKFVRT